MTTLVKDTAADKPRPDFSKNANHAATAPAYLSVYDLHAYYGESYIVQGVNFNVHEGEILALLGRNGAGKTSTLRAIARLDNPQVTHGEIWLDHKPLHRMTSYEAATNGLSLVPEDRRIIPGLTVEENIQLAQIRPADRLGRWNASTNCSPVSATPQAGRRDAFGRRAADAVDRPRTGPRHQGFFCLTSLTRVSRR
jgi:ABC-type branched-subunit amino acid transport system ATPase component